MTRMHSTRARPRRRTRLGLVVVLGLLASAPPARGEPQPESATDGDVMRGWRIFTEKQCIECHAVWGQGGNIGPDLGRLRSGRLSGDRLAGIMWNHIPKMLARMKQAGHPPETITAGEMVDVFALINFVRQLDEPGDPAEGEKILRLKGCTECHAIDTSGTGIGPDLAKWGSYANPIIWAQMMWEHAPVMEEAMRRSGMMWPKLQGTDLVHIVAYVRSAGISGEKTYLRPGSAKRGKRLFTEKKCDSCHPGDGPDLATVELPVSLGALASRMWNHSPAMTRVMREKAVERQPVDPQELADILTYVLMLPRAAAQGDPVRGRRVFKQKGCAQCHDRGDVAEAAGPSVRQLGASAAPASMAAAMWNHGEKMLEQMTEVGLSWPVFDDDEMVDLLAYLKAAGTDVAGKP